MATLRANIQLARLDHVHVEKLLQPVHNVIDKNGYFKTYLHAARIQINKKQRARQVNRSLAKLMQNCSKELLN